MLTSDRLGSGVGLGLAGSTVAIAVAASATAWLLRPPAPLPDRLGKIAEKDVEIDNDDLYNSFGWWEDYHPLQATNAARVPYFLDTISKVLKKDANLKDVQILDIGCGGGLVTEEIARKTRARVTGIDSSQNSIDDARKHMKESATKESFDRQDDLAQRLEYVVGSAYELPFESGSFDAIVCSDVFEHLLDLRVAMKEMTRVLKPGGVLVYDTINRSVFAWYATIVFFQKLLKFVPDHAHDWRLYIKPDEMRRLTDDCGLEHSSATLGMIPTPTMPWTLLRRWWRMRSVSLWAMMGPFVLTRFTHASYLSYAIKPAR